MSLTKRDESQDRLDPLANRSHDSDLNSIYYCLLHVSIPDRRSAVNINVINVEYNIILQMGIHDWGMCLLLSGTCCLLQPAFFISVEMYNDGITSIRPITSGDGAKNENGKQSV